MKEKVLAGLRACDIGIGCDRCPYHDIGVPEECIPVLLENAQALIVALSTENERLSAENEKIRASRRNVVTLAEGLMEALAEGEEERHGAFDGKR